MHRTETNSPMLRLGAATDARSATAGTDRLLLNVTDVAQLLGIGRNLTYELVREKRLPHIRLGRRILIPREALDNWLLREAEAAKH